MGKWNWYGVKIIKQLILQGEPHKDLVDRYYEASAKRQHFEESIILVRAQSFDHAYKIAESKTAKDNEVYTNRYGQQTTWKLVDAVDCFLIYDDPTTGAEIYSCFHNAPKETTPDEFLDGLLGSVEHTPLWPAMYMEFSPGRHLWEALHGKQD